jgi:uncharacterized protein
MKCPKCTDITLKKNKIDTIEIDECPNCNGVWFDKDELRQSKDIYDPDLNWMDFDIWKHKDQFKVLENSLSCPSCEKQMVVINYADTKVEIDYCPYCQGVWLDSGEFMKIINSLEKELKSMGAGSYLKETLREATDLFNGKEGFLSEWKDFKNVLRLMKYRVFIENPSLQKSVDTIKNIPIK